MFPAAAHEFRERLVHAARSFRGVVGKYNSTQMFVWCFSLQRGKAAFPPPCFLENRGLEGVWAPPWGVLEGSGRLLGGSWLQEASWVFCRLLSGGSWAAQEPSWGPRWTQVEGQDGSKILPRRPKMSLRCLQDCPRSDFQSKSKEK